MVELLALGLVLGLAAIGAGRLRGLAADLRALAAGLGQIQATLAAVQAGQAATRGTLAQLARTQQVEALRRDLLAELRPLIADTVDLRLAAARRGRRAAGTTVQTGGGPATVGPDGRRGVFVAGSTATFGGPVQTGDGLPAAAPGAAGRREPR
ncbi:MAG TPA: hypothetical protein VKY74_15155 [Chloroflexia bacterium]|nr:hypothetical protein [Chloroflexia bacterium]